MIARCAHERIMVGGRRTRRTRRRGRWGGDGIQLTSRCANIQPVICLFGRNSKSVDWNGLTEVVLPIELEKTGNRFRAGKQFCVCELYVAHAQFCFPFRKQGPEVSA